MSKYQNAGKFVASIARPEAVF